MPQATTDRVTLRKFFTTEVLKRVHYKNWRFGVRMLPLDYGGQFTVPGHEEQLVIYIPLSGQEERRPEECWDFYQFRFWLSDYIVDNEIYDALKWMFETVIMHIERVFAEASFLYGTDRLMLSDDSIEVVRWDIVQRFSY